MDFRDAISWILTIPSTGATRNTDGHNSDLEYAPTNHSNLEGKEGTPMIRMFRRLLRGGGRSRMVGGWIV